MYLALLKSCIVEGLRNCLGQTAPNPNFRNLNVSIEYPLAKQDYPGIWVNYDDSDSLEIAGIDHKEFVLDTEGLPHEVTRWIFAGQVSLTCVALSSLERDTLYDEVVRLFAFGRIEKATPSFRDQIENNDFIAVYANWDQLRPHGDAAAPGTPWGTEDEVVYEKSLAFDVEGEFVSNWEGNALMMLSKVNVMGVAVDADDDPIGMDPLALSVPNQFTRARGAQITGFPASP